MSECVCSDQKTWTPGCSRWYACAEEKNGGGLPRLETVWGGRAADQGMYRSMIGSDAFFQDGKPSGVFLPHFFFAGSPAGPVD